MTVSNKKKSLVRSKTPLRRCVEGAAPGASGCRPERCPGCGNTLGAGYAFCPHCGKSLKKTCPVCGKLVEGGRKVCPSCGADVDPGEVRQV